MLNFCMHIQAALCGKSFPTGFTIKFLFAHFLLKPPNRYIAANNKIMLPKRINPLYFIMKIVAVNPKLAGNSSDTHDKQAGHAGTNEAITALTPVVDAPATFCSISHSLDLKLYICNESKAPNKIEYTPNKNKLTFGITLNHKSRFCKPPVANDCATGKNIIMKTDEIIMILRYFLFFKIRNNLYSMV